MDPEMEKMRLAEQYAGLNDLELEELAEDWESLTDAAYEALCNEMARRDMKPPDKPTASKVETEVALTDPVAAGEFRGWREALLAWGLLHSGGIRSQLTDSIGSVLNPEEFGQDYAEAIAPGLSGPITLSVSAADYDTAREVLSQPAQEDPEPEE
jgi:hypothetical protein